MILVYEKLPVDSSFGSFNSMMPRAPGLESGIATPMSPDPSFPDGPAGCSLPLGDPGPQLPSEEEAGPAGDQRQVRWGVGTGLTLPGDTRLFRNGGVGSKGQTDERTLLKN